MMKFGIILLFLFLLHIHGALENKRILTNVHSLSPEIVQDHILKHLNVDDLNNFKIVSKEFRGITREYLDKAMKHPLKESRHLLDNLITEEDFKLVRLLLTRFFTENQVELLIEILETFPMSKVISAVYIGMNQEQRQRLSRTRAAKSFQECESLKSNINLLVARLNEIPFYAYDNVVGRLFPIKTTPLYQQFKQRAEIQNPDGSTYLGQFKLKNTQKMMHGEGILKLANGERYKGVFDKGEIKIGLQSFPESTKIRYRGFFSNFKWEIKGDEFYENGETKYRGRFQNGKYHGPGILWDNHRQILQGAYKNKQDKIIPIGSFKHGEYDMDSFKTILKEKSEEERAEILNGSSDLIFKIILLDKMQENVEFLDKYFRTPWTYGREILGYIYSKKIQGKANGYGYLFGLDLQGRPYLKYKGSFEKSQIQVKNGEMYHPNGQLSYVGQFKNTMRDGNGVAFDNNGKKYYKGEFKEDLPHGRGVWISEKEFKIGSIYIFSLSKMR